MKKYCFLLMILLIIGCEEPPQLGMRTPATIEQARSMQLTTSQQMSMPAEKTVAIADGVTMEFVLIPAGEFHMGSPSKEKGRGSKESPQHQVKISKAFYLGKYEVTQQQYEAVLGTNRKIKFRGEKRPVENVEWYQAVMFCKAISNKTGLKMRLPSEAEWEYSCRAGTNTAFYTGEVINPDQANYNWNHSYNGSRTATPLGSTAKVGSYPPNAFGLYDMHGNVWEWCQDVYRGDFYKNSPEVNPVNDGPKGSRVIRGGSWKQGPDKLRSAVRSKRIAGADRKHLGFRVLMEID